MPEVKRNREFSPQMDGKMREKTRVKINDLLFAFIIGLLRFIFGDSHLFD